MKHFFVVDMVEFLDAKFFNRIKGVALNSINGPLDKN